eukprot:366000-Chlamydomonas_euryale.AAC.14
MHVAAIKVRCQSRVLAAKLTLARKCTDCDSHLAASNLAAHYGALRPPVRLEACLALLSVGCIEAASGIEAHSPRGCWAGRTWGILPHGP